VRHGNLPKTQKISSGTAKKCPEIPKTIHRHVERLISFAGQVE
jgi:hypothetical protein